MNLMLPMNSLNRKINKTELNSKSLQLQTTGHFSCFFCLFVASSCNTLITFSHQELTGSVLCLNPDFTSDWTDRELHLLFQQVMQTAQETRARMKSCLSNPAAKPKQAMSIQRRRFYLPHELTLTIVTIVYIRPNANVSTQPLPTYKLTAERELLNTGLGAASLCHLGQSYNLSPLLIPASTHSRNKHDQMMFQLQHWLELTDWSIFEHLDLETFTQSVLFYIKCCRECDSD